jgi:hypothetical protein
MEYKNEVITDELGTISENFTKKVDEAFRRCGYTSPFTYLGDEGRQTVGEKFAWASFTLECYKESSAFACMLCIQQFNGVEMPKVMCNPVCIPQPFLSLLFECT